MRSELNIADTIICDMLTNGIENEWNMHYQFEKRENGKYQYRLYEKYNIGKWENITKDEMLEMYYRCEEFWAQEYAESL